MTESTGTGFDPFAKPIPTTTVAEVPDVETLVVSPNPGQIAWPTDRWGYTSKLRKEFCLSAMTINGQPDKQALMLRTLDLMRGHLLARFEKDQGNRERQRKMAEEHAADRVRRGHR